MARKPQKLGPGSKAAHVAAFKAATQIVDPPADLPITDPTERAIWDAITSQRSVEDWRAFDLVTAHRLMKLEMQIRDLTATLESEGTIINGRFGPVAHPANTLLSAANRDALAVARSLSLNSSAGDRRQLESRAATEQKARRTLAKQGVDSLLARPS